MAKAPFLKSRDATLNKVRELEVQDQLQQAVELLMKTIEFNFSNAEYYLELGKLQLKMKNACVAELALRRVLQLQPGHLPALKLLYPLYDNAKQFSLAVEVMREICASAPDVGVNLYRLGVAELRIKNYVAALSALRSVAEADPGLHSVLYYLSIAQEKLGQIGAAKETLQQAIALRGADGNLTSRLQALETQEAGAEAISPDIT